MRIRTRTSTGVAAGKLGALALAALAASAVGQAGRAGQGGTDPVVAAAPASVGIAPACRAAAWPDPSCADGAGPARRVRVIAIGAASGPLPR